MTKETINPEVTKENALVSFLKSTSWSIPFIALIVLIITFSLRLINNADIGFHLKGGQWILENLKFPANDVFTYTVNSHEYIDMQWLYQVIIYLVQNIFGYEGMTIFNVLLILTVFYLLYRVMQVREVPLPITILSLFLVLMVIQFRFSYRPELMSWIGIMLTLLIMEVYYYSGKKNLYFLPVIMLVWVNMHGLFMIGLFMIGCYVISTWIRDKKPDLYLLKWFGISIAATLVNPYFVTGATYPFYLLTRLDESNIFAQTIFELKSPFGTGFENLRIELTLFYVSAGLSAALSLITFKKRKIHEFLILTAFLYISYTAIRNVPIFMLYSGFILALCSKDIFLDLFTGLPEKLKPVSKPLALILAVLFLLLSARVVTGNYYISYGKGVDFGVGLNENSFPVKALEHLNSLGLNGRIINDISYGGWLEWQYTSQVFIDGRLEVIGEDLYREFLDAVNNNKLPELIEKYNAIMVIFNHGSTISWISQLRDLPGWGMAYLDDNTAVFGKADKLPNARMNSISDFFLEEGLIPNYTTDDVNRILNINPGFTTGDWFAGFYKPHKQYLNLIDFSLFCLDIGRLKEAELVYLNVLDKSNGKLEDDILKELYFNLGTIYHYNENYTNALKCYYVAVKYDPANQELNRRIAELRSLKQN